MKSHFTDFHQTRKEHRLAVSVELAQQAQKSSVMTGRDHITPLRLASLADNPPQKKVFSVLGFHFSDFNTRGSFAFCLHKKTTLQFPLLPTPSTRNTQGEEMLGQPDLLETQDELYVL